MTSRFSKLSDVADVIDSLHKTPKYSNAGKAMVRCTDVKYGKLNLDNTFKVSNEVFAEFSRRYTPMKDDIIITRVGSYGITALVKNTEFCLGQNTAAIVRKKINPRYLYIALNSPFVRNQIEFSVVGSTQKTLSLKAINNLDIPRFDEDVENKIAKIGGEIDDKIELNRQTNQTIEQIAQALFKSWFVDFEPVKAKIAAKQAGCTAEQIERAAMAAISGKTESELDQLTPEQFQTLKTTAALFPSAMQTTELGEIPVGWELQRLSETIEIIGGGTPKRSEPDYWCGSINWFSVKDAPNDGDVFVIDTEEKITELGVQKSSTKVLPVGTTIISARGTVGKLALAGVETAMNQSCYGVKGVNGIGQYLNYLNVKYMVTELQQNTHGAVFDTITKQTFETVHIVKASNEINCRFERFITPLFEQIRNQLFEINTLADTRDSLLPKLLSGEFN